MEYEPVPIETNAEARAAYEADRCDAYTTAASGLAATKATFDDLDAHMVYPEIVSKEPLGPLVRHGDDQVGGHRTLGAERRSPRIAGRPRASLCAGSRWDTIGYPTSRRGPW